MPPVGFHFPEFPPRYWEKVSNYVRVDITDDLKQQLTNNMTNMCYLEGSIVAKTGFHVNVPGVDEPVFFTVIAYHDYGRGSSREFSEGYFYWNIETTDFDRSLAVRELIASEDPRRILFFSNRKYR